ncbi:MAG: methyltransferase, partial [Pseudomonadota bacterium]
MIDIASEIARDGVFIIPQLSSGFEFSGVQCYQRRESSKYTAFAEATGLFVDAGMGIDTSVTSDGWKGVKQRVEIALVDFTGRD